MSKSRGTGIDADEAMNRYGADVLRLWAASVEYVDDVRFGPNVIEQVARVYRNVRNRIRFMLGNVGDLLPEQVVPRERMAPLDALACAYADTIFHGIFRAYGSFDIHAAYVKILEFESQMSALYFDAVKDPLYSLAASDPRRRSAQSALLYALRGFLAAVAPVLSFTAEEAWQALAPQLRGDSESVFDLSLPHGAQEDRAASDWAMLRAMRATVAGNPSFRDFAAKAVLEMPERTMTQRWWTLLDSGAVREALVVSQLEVRSQPSAQSWTLVTLPADGEKCARCWKYRELKTNAAHPDVCRECATVLDGLAP